MPRGNDSEGNRAWQSATMDQYGIYGNAEELINAHRASVDPAVQKASLIREDEEQSASANGDLAATAEKLKDQIHQDEVLVAAAVRGNAVIGVLEGPSGGHRKVVGAWNDSYRPPKLSEAEVAQHSVAKERAAIDAEIARLRIENDRRLSELEQEMATKLTAAIDDATARLAGVAEPKVEPKAKAEPKAKGEKSAPKDKAKAEDKAEDTTSADASEDA